MRSVPALLVAWWTSFVASTAQGAQCPSGTVALDVITTADVERLVSELSCTGYGNFNITWHNSLQIEHIIEVSNKKNITVIGSGFPTIRGALGNDNDAGGGFIKETSDGIFSVSKGSTLRLDHLALQGGYSRSGGAIRVYSSSWLVVSGCSFTDNHASKHGGDSPTL